LELETAISTVFAPFLSSNLPFSLEFATFGYYLQHFGAGNCHFNSVFAPFLSSNLSFPLEFATFWYYLQHFGAGNCHFNSVFAAFLKICNTSVLKLLM